MLAPCRSALSKVSPNVHNHMIKREKSEQAVEKHYYTNAKIIPQLATFTPIRSAMYCFHKLCKGTKDSYATVPLGTRNNFNCRCCFAHITLRVLSFLEKDRVSLSSFLARGVAVKSAIKTNKKQLQIQKLKHRFITKRT